MAAVTRSNVAIKSAGLKRVLSCKVAWGKEARCSKLMIIVTNGHPRLVMPGSLSPILLAIFKIDVEHGSYRPRLCSPSDVSTETSEKNLIK